MGYIKAARGLLLVALALLAAPYTGLRHDAVLYFGQLMQHADPTLLAADIFFSSGSQDRFSLFSTLMTPLLQWFGMSALQLSLVMLGQLASYAALYRLLAPLGNEVQRWSGLLFVACLSHRYGGQGIFGFAENFLTARTLAEPLILWAFVALLRGGRGLALCLMFAAGMLHPIMALPALVIAWMLLLAADRRWLWALLLVGVPPLLAVLGVEPFDALMRVYDDAWWELINEVNQQVVLTNWTSTDWQAVALDLLTLVAAWRWLPAALARLSGATLVASAVLMTGALLAADVAHNALLTQLQLWRVLWIAHALALCVAPALIALAWREGRAGRLLASGLVLLFLAADAKFSHAWLLLLWCAVWGALLVRDKPISRPLSMLAGLVGLLLVLILSAGSLSDGWLLARLSYGDAAPRPFWLQVLGLPAVLLGIGLLVLNLGQRHPRSAVLATLLLALAGASGADARSDWTRMIEQGVGQKHPFEAFIPPGKQVYWHGEFGATWFLLHRPSFYDKAQGAGLLFNAGTAREFAPRWEAWKPIREQMQGCRFSSLLGHKSPAECITPARSELVKLCRSQSKLDYLIIGQALDLQALASWNPRLPRHPEQTFYLYACQQLR